jgi:hypothetical protein
MNSENLGARITGNRALDQKIWALEAFKGKIVFSRCSRGICGIFEWLQGLGIEHRSFAEFRNFSRIFVDFLE